MIRLILTKRLYLFIGFIILLLVLLFFANLTLARTNPGGYDFFTNWYASRIYIKDGIDPYSDIAVARISEAMIDELDPGENEIFRFASPLFSIIFLTPFSLVGDYTIARALWMTLLEVSLVATVWMLSSFNNVKKKIFVTSILSVIILFCLPSISAIMSGSLTILAMVLFVLAVILIINQHDEAAGLVLCFSLVKAELFYPGVLLILAWAAFRGRWRIIWWLLGTFTLVMGFSILLIPGWMISYLQVILKYSGINPLVLLVSNDTAMTFRLNLVKNVAVAILLVFEWIVVRFQGRRKTAWNAGLLLLMLPWFGRDTHIEQTILYLPALTLIIGLFLSTWKEKTYISILLFPILIFIMGWAFSGVYIKDISIVLSRIIVYVVQPLIILVFFYWVRWWVLRSEKFNITAG